MRTPLNLNSKRFPVILGIVTLASVAVLLVWDFAPSLFPAGFHDLLGAFPLASIAVAYLFYQIIRRPGGAEMFKAVLLAVAFLFWAANQYWPASRWATLFNDIAIALFVLDVVFVIVGWPASSPNESFAESFAEPQNEEPNA